MSDDPFSSLTPIHGAENVRPLHGQTNAQRQEVLKPRAKALMDAALYAGNVKPQLDRPYIIKGWLDRNTTSLWIGPSNVGKTFALLNSAHHVSKGREWAGRRVRKGRVLYLAAEGGSNFLN